MSKPAFAANLLSLPSPTPVPVRSPRTSIILAELARQRRFKRRRRRLKRQQRRRASAAMAVWLAALGRLIHSTARLPFPSRPP